MGIIQITRYLIEKFTSVASCLTKLWEFVWEEKMSSIYLIKKASNVSGNETTLKKNLFALMGGSDMTFEVLLMQKEVLIYIILMIYL